MSLQKERLRITFRNPGCSVLRQRREGVLFAQLHKPGGEACDLADGAQDVVPLFGVFAQISDAFGLCKQRSDVLLSLRTPVGIGQPGLLNTEVQFSLSDDRPMLL